jgi:flagellar assembly factor FliW
MPAVAQPVPTSPVATDDRVIASRLLGDIRVPASQLFTFPEGLHGFAQHTEYALVPAARAGFWWLQATDEEALAFLLVDPFQVAPGYEVDLSEGDQRFLGLTTPDDALVLAVVTLPAASGGPATTNLRGPLVLNTRLGRARQVVRADDSYSLQAPLTLD